MWCNERALKSVGNMAWTPHHSPFALHLILQKWFVEFIHYLCLAIRNLEKKKREIEVEIQDFFFLLKLDGSFSIEQDIQVMTCQISKSQIKFPFSPTSVLAITEAILMLCSLPGMWGRGACFLVCILWHRENSRAGSIVKNKTEGFHLIDMWRFLYFIQKGKNWLR